MYLVSRYNIVLTRIEYSFYAFHIKPVNKSIKYSQQLHLVAHIQYTVSQKNKTPYGLLLFVSLPSIGLFSKFFHWQNNTSIQESNAHMYVSLCYFVKY